MLTLALCCASFLLAQAGPAARPIGVITNVDAVARRIAIKTDAGSDMTISFEDAARFLQVAPGAKDLTNAAVISMADLAVGDRILARGRSGDAPSSVVANTIIVMSKADIARKHAAERAEWEKRGIPGVVIAIDPASKEFTIKTPGAKLVVIGFSTRAVLRRYAPNSVRFSDARPSRFEELQVGDQVKALGTSSEDKSRFIAEVLVSGSFRNIAATVVATEPGGGAIQMAELTTGRRMQVQITSDSAVRRLPAPVAQTLAAGLSTGRADVQSLLETLPALSPAELKPGVAVILSCTNSGEAARVTAITLLAGVEPLLKTASRGGRPLDIGSWNLDLSMNVGAP